MEHTYTFFIKNMVCARCVAAVKNVLHEAGLSPRNVVLGSATVDGVPTEGQLHTVDKLLRAQGFELLQTPESRKVEDVKKAVRDFVRREHPASENLSDFIIRRLNGDYSALSRLFSATTGETIEHYALLQRTEYAKELLAYGELSVKEIAYRLGFSSAAHLSAQFKSQTGFSPSAFRKMGGSLRKGLDEL